MRKSSIHQSEGTFIFQRMNRSSEVSNIITYDGVNGQITSSINCFWFAEFYPATTLVGMISWP
jgi:hypothetical protein